MNLSSVDVAVFHGVDAGGIDATVSEDIGESYYIFLDRVIGAGEEVAEVVRKDLLFGDACFSADLFHVRPYI